MAVGRAAQVPATGRRIALCHEWITTYGGSEQVAARLARALEIHDVFTFVYDAALATRLFGERSVNASYQMPFGSLARRRWPWFLPLMPRTWRRLDLTQYDVVVTSSHAFVNTVRPRPDAVLISYCHTPIRYGWEWQLELDRLPSPLKVVWPAVASRLRKTDIEASSRVDVYVANSNYVAERIHRYYGRESLVLYPPIDTQFWAPDGGAREDFFLLTGRMVAYKQPAVAARAAAEAGVRIVVAGSGPELPRVRACAAGDTIFYPNPSDVELRDLYRRARALVFAGVEDFGMSLVEAQACGTPVIARNIGGAREAVIDGVTGCLYDGNSSRELAAALRSFDPEDFDSQDLREHARRFDASEFDEQIRQIVREAADRGNVPPNLDVKEKNTGNRSLGRSVT